MGDDLENLSGVGPATAEKLNEAGFNSFKSIAVASAGDLSTEADIGESSANKIIKAAREKADVGGFESGSEIMERRNSIGRLKLRIEEVDQLFGGGIETQSITEFYGEFGAGKSQITHQLSVNVQLPEEYGGLGRGCIFIDSEDTFRPARIGEMVQGLEEEPMRAMIDEYGVDATVDEVKNAKITDRDGRMIDESPAVKLADEFLENIHVAKAATSDHQILLAEKVTDKAEEYRKDEELKDIGLVCIDSLTAHFRAEYVGRGELADRQQKLNKHLHDISKAADLYNLAAVITNQVAANPDSYFGDPTQAIGGNILGHTSTFRIYLRKSKDNKRIVRLVDAPNLEDGEAVVRIENSGVKPE